MTSTKKLDELDTKVKVNLLLYFHELAFKHSSVTSLGGEQLLLWMEHVVGGGGGGRTPNY